MIDRTTLNREQSVSTDLDRQDQPRPSGGASVVVMTTTVAKYPTTAKAVYAVQEYDIGGPETEGQAYTTSKTGNPFFAANLGGSIPPSGTILAIDRIVGSGRWVFRYDGSS